MLIATGLLVRSFDRLLRTNLGFRPDELLTVRLELPFGKYGGDGGRRNQFARSLFKKLAVVPGVESAAITSRLPLQGWRAGHHPTSKAGRRRDRAKRRPPGMPG